MNFLEAFRAALDGSGLTEEELAVKLGVRANTIARWKSGHRVPTGPLWQALRDNLPGFAARIDGGKLVGRAAGSRS